MAADYTSTINGAAKSWNVDPTLLQALIEQESGYNPKAVSKAGAVGLTQLMPDTAKGMGVTDPTDPVQQIYGGAKYLSRALDAEKTPEDALNFYHGGPAWRNTYGPESAAYAPAVTARYTSLASQAKASAPSAQNAPAAIGDDPFTAALEGAQSGGAEPAADPFTQALTAAQEASTPAPPPAEVESGQVDDFGRPIMVAPGPAQSAQVAAPSAAYPPPSIVAAQRGAAEGFGSEPLGLSPQTDQALVNAGVYNGPNEYNPLKGINRALIGGGAALGDLALRSGAAAFRGAQGYVSQSLSDLGAPRLGQDIAAIPEAFQGEVGGGGMHGEEPIPAPAPSLRDPLATTVTPRSVLVNGAPNALQPAVNDVYANPLARSPDAAAAPAFVPPGSNIPAPATAPATAVSRPAFVPPEPAPAVPAAASVPAQVVSKGQTAPATNLLQSNARPSATRAANDVNPLMPTPANDAEAYPAWNASKAQTVAPAAPAAAEPLAAPPPAPARTVPSAAEVPATSGPQSVGAAASRDMTAPEVITAKTPEQKLTDLGKDVTQSAEDRAGPQMEDHATYVPGVERPLQERVFSPQNSLDDKTLRATDPEYRAQQEAIERGNNQTMVDLLGNDAGDANALKVAHDEREAVAPPAQQLFAGEKPVDAAPLVKQIDDTLSGPAGKRAAVVRTLTAVKQSLFDADGNLETMPSQLYGARQNITDLLKKGVGEGADDVRASKPILTGLLDKMDPIINDGAPKYQAYLDQFHEASQPINQMEFLQKYQTGSKKLTNVDGYLQLNKVQKILDDIYQGQKAKGINPAKSLTDDQVQNIVNVRNELAAKSLSDRLAKVKGSDTTQQTNRAGILGDGPLGSAVKGAAEMGAHALLFHTTGGIGNAAMAIHKAVVKPARAAAKAEKVANALTARKAELLSTQSNPLQTP